jgi:ADP-heptose:LPS heptosyltransferase
LRIAIINFSKFDELEHTLNQLESLYKNIIGVEIDLFCDDKVALDARLQSNSYIRNIYPQKIDNISFFTLNGKYKSLRYYTKFNRYHIAVDTQGEFLSAITTYVLAGNTAGFTSKPLKNKLIAKLFYDETLDVKDMEKENQIYNLFHKTFGFEEDAD